MLFVHLVGKVIEKILKVVMLGWLNKLFGAVFGLLKAVLIIGLIILLFDAINTNIPLVKEETINGSILYGPIKDIANIIFPYLKELIFKK